MDVNGVGYGLPDGRPLLEFKAATQEKRNRLALGMFRAWYVPFYNYGVIHGDPGCRLHLILHRVGNHVGRNSLGGHLRAAF